MAHSVAIVVNRNFGDQLLELAQRLHVWICSTPENQRIVDLARRQSGRTSPNHGVTIFDTGDEESPEEMLICVLANVDIHHGGHSGTPRWDTIEVFGATPTPQVMEAVSELGVTEFSTFPGGFWCSRL